MILNFSKVEEKKKTFSMEEVLSLVDQKTIYEYYLNQSIKFNSYILSPFRKENNPSFKFNEYKGKILGKDWATGEIFNCFQFIQKKYNLSLPEAIKVIVNDFNLYKDVRNKSTGNMVYSSRNITSEFLLGSSPMGYVDSTRKESKITIQEQPFTKVDIDYWNPLELSDIIEDVISCKLVYLNDKLIKFYTNDNPIYAYKYIVHEEVFYKIYCPFAKKQWKWLYSGNKSIIDGYNKLPIKGNLLFITKSRKDRLYLKKLGFDSISLMNEGVLLENLQYNELKYRFKDIILFYDNDVTGIEISHKIANMYNIQEIFIPIELGCKDISEVVKKYSLEYAKDLINSLI